jgi:hypothetical protein
MTVSENNQRRNLMMENKDQVLAERSVLEWFYLDPSRLNEYLTGVEQRIGALRL